MRPAHGEADAYPDNLRTLTAVSERRLIRRADDLAAGRPETDHPQWLGLVSAERAKPPIWSSATTKGCGPHL